MTSLAGAVSPAGSRGPSSTLWPHGKPESTHPSGTAVKKDDLKSAASTAPQVRSPQLPRKSSKPLAGAGQAGARRPSLYLRDAEKYNRAHYMRYHLDSQVK